MKAIAVLLCDDHPVVRDGLRLLLEETQDIRVVGEASNGRQGVQATRKLFPDVVLMDFYMPLLNGAEATRQIAEESPATKVLFLSAYSDDLHVQQAMEAGAAGYLMKVADAEELFHAIREIAGGKAFFSPPIARRLSRQQHEEFLNGGSLQNEAGHLTHRQVEILQMVAEGYANKQIADFLSLSIKTVEKHRQALMNTLDIHNTATLTRYAVALGVVECEQTQELAPVSRWPVRESCQKYRGAQTSRGLNHRRRDGEPAPAPSPFASGGAHGQSDHTKSN